MSVFNNVDIKLSITRTVIELFDSMLSMEVEPGTEISDKGLDGGRIVGNVNYAGAVVGMVSVHAGSEFSRKITGAMLGAEADDSLDEEAVKDVIGEITNMVSGNLTTELVNSGLSCVISAPSITTGSDFEIDPLDADLTQQLIFKYKDHNLLVEMCLKEESVDDEFVIKSDGLSSEEIMEKIGTVDLGASLINSVIDVFYTMLSMEVERISELPEAFIEHQRTVGSVSFAGDVDGLFNLQVNDDFARQMTASMLGMEPDEIEGDEEVHDVIRELSNIIGGNLKSNFVDVGLSCQLSTPSITMGKDFRIESLKIDTMETFLFKYDDQVIIVEAGIKKDDVSVAEKAVAKAREPEIPEPVPHQESQPQVAFPPLEEAIRDVDFIMDIPLEVTVELGRSKKKINDLLKMKEGSVVELEQLEGEPVDILVNETLIAKGQVVVEKEKYGIRISEIVSRKERVNSLK